MIHAPSPYQTLDIFFASNKSHLTPQYLPNLNTTVIPRVWDDAMFPTALLIKVENLVAVTACSTANVTVPELVNGLKFQSMGTKIKQAALQIALSMVILYLIYRYRKKFMAKFNAWHFWYRDGSPMFDRPTDKEAELPAYDDTNAVQPPPLPNLMMTDNSNTDAAVAAPLIITQYQKKVEAGPGI
ncbi:hypothetical protein GGF32_004368 [Allomyces javanicus]|nr:hypothetical protein GGF32_004368 [Allomyces javanicus]